MHKIAVTLDLPEGLKKGTVETYSTVDAKKFLEIYHTWVQYSNLLVSMGGRRANIPDILSEGTLALAKGFWRSNANISGANSSFDCYDPNGKIGNNRIQAKACSVIPDLSSFGPRSVWDRIFFLDFFREGNWDCTFDVYEIETFKINSHKVNGDETVKDQKLAGKRPRLSLYTTFVESKDFLSKETYTIQEAGILRIV